MAEQRRSEKQLASKSTGVYIVITIAALVLLALWVFAFDGSEQLSPDKIRVAITPSIPSTPVNETYKFITYRNAKWGFSLQHPVGFIAEEPSLEAPEFRAYAGRTGGVPEVVEVIVDNSTTASEEFQDIFAASAEAGETNTRIFNSTMGKYTRLLVTNTLLPVAGTNEASIVYQALFDCTQEDEFGNFPYTALLLITIPAGLQSDLPVAEYVVNSFNC